MVLGRHTALNRSLPGDTLTIDGLCQGSAYLGTLSRHNAASTVSGHWPGPNEAEPTNRPNVQMF